MHTFSYADNLEHLVQPQPGDFWVERVCVPYFLVVKVEGDKITILDAADRTVYHDSWEFDYTKHKVVDLAWMKKQVMYRSGGFVADCRTGEKYLKIIEAWKQFHRARLAQELKEFE